MVLFHSDIDNTLIYSYKHEIGSDKVGVERYQGRMISYMTSRSHALLKQVAERLLLVPTTTRTAEQYNRINFGIPSPKYALVCNGGILLRDGQADRAWYEESYEMTRGAAGELAAARDYLIRDVHRCFEVRIPDELFLFTKSECPLETAQGLKQVVDTTKIDICCQGIKVYVIPKNLNKGTACQRFREKQKADCVVAAGDSQFDVPMLKAADIAIAPMQLRDAYNLEAQAVCAAEDGIFSDFLLEYLLHLSDTRGN